MKLLIGTSKGVYTTNGSANAPRKTLDSKPVRDIAHLSGRVFAGTGSGLFISDDGGESWHPPLIVEREVWQTRAASDGTLYTTTRPAGVFKSADNGTTWNELASFAAHPDAKNWCVPIDPPLPGQARTIVIDQTNPQALWVGVEVGGVMRSADGGETWHLDLPGNNPDLHNLCQHPDDSKVLFASTGYGRADGIAEMIEGNAGVFRSNDGGTNWQYAWRGITPRYSRPMCIDPRTPYGLTVASAPDAFSSYKSAEGAGAMLFRSEDLGESWRSLCDANHSPSSANIHGLAPDPESPGGVLIGTDTGETWRVNNEGRWRPIADQLPPVLALATIA